MSWTDRLNSWLHLFRVLDRKLLRDLWHIRAQGTRHCVGYRFGGGRFCHVFGHDAVDGSHRSGLL